jgi:hypothetical protein
MALVFQDTLNEASSIALTSHAPELGGAWTSGTLITVGSVGATTTSTSMRTAVSNFATPAENFEFKYSFVMPSITGGASRTKVYFDDGSTAYGAEVRWVGGTSYIDIYELSGNTNLATYSGTPSVWAEVEHAIKLTYIDGVTSVYLDDVLVGTSNTAVPPAGGTLKFELYTTVSVTPRLALTHIEVSTIPPAPAGMDIVTSFTAENLAASSVRKPSLNAIPIEAFWSLPKDVWNGAAGWLGSINVAANYAAINNVAYDGDFLPISSSEFTFDYASSGNYTSIATSEVVGLAQWTGSSSADYYSGFLNSGLGATPSFYAGLPDNVEIVVSHVTNLFDGSSLTLGGYKPGVAAVGMRPMTDDAYSGYTFIDNLAFNGNADLQINTGHDLTLGPLAAGTNNHFIGFIRRSAIGIPGSELADADIVLGIVSTEVSARLVLNGTVLTTWTHSYAYGRREIYVTFVPQADTTGATYTDLNSVAVTLDCYAIGTDASGTWDSQSHKTDNVTVDFAEAVIYASNEADYEGLGGSYTGYADGYYSVQAGLYSYWGEEVAHGNIYFTGDVFGDLDQPIDIVMTSFGDVDQPLDVFIIPPFGDVTQALEISFITPWQLGGDQVHQPLTISFTSSGDVDQALDISFAAPHGDMVQPIDIRVIGFGDVDQPIDIALRDPAETTTVWKIRALVGGVDINNRTTGEGSVRGEEGGARIASLVLKPETGPIDAEAMSGQPVVIDFMMRSGGNWTARRLFTGKVDKPVWDVNRGTLSLSCTDDLQNRVAALSREAIDAITGGRFHLAVQGEQPNNWDYAQAVMESVAGSLDADAYGALRVTPWHSEEVWNTYTTANTEQGSIYFTLPARTGIVNQITGTFEYRFTRLHRRTASMNYLGDLHKTIHYGLPLLARATVEAALAGSGWNFYYGGSAIGPGGGGGETSWGVTDGQPVTPNINYTPYPESYDLPGGGLWYQRETDTTCLGFSCSMWRRWAQTVTERYELTVSAPESIAANGLQAREDRASLASAWDAGSWESDPAAKPSLPLGGKHVTLDYAPDAGTADRDAGITTFLDTLNVRIVSTHREARGGARTWLTPEIDQSKRLRIEKGANEGEGKVISFEHSWDQEGGRAVTAFEIAITRHGAVGITPPVDTPREAPAAPAVPVISSSAFASLYDVPSLHIGALTDSPDEDENWTGWIVNVPSSYNVDDPGSTEPSINPETQKTERKLVNDPYRGGTANPLFRADKAYTNTGFRVRLPAVEDESRDAAEPVVKSTYTIAILQDDFTLTA